MARPVPHSVERDFAGAMHAGDHAPRHIYLATTPEGQQVLRTMCMYTLPKAAAFLFRSLWGVRAPKQFRSLQGHDKTVWEFSGLDEIERAVMKEYTGFQRMATRYANDMFRMMTNFYGHYLANHVPDLWDVYPRVGMLTDDILNMARDYIETEIQAIVDAACHAKKIKTIRLSRRPSAIPAKYRVFEDRSPTSHIDVRLDYLMNTDEGRAIVTALKDECHGIRTMPVFIFKKLWGREAPERFQSFVSSDQCTYEYIDTGAIDVHNIRSRTIRNPTTGARPLATNVVAKLAKHITKFMFDFLETLANETNVCEEADPLVGVRYWTIHDINFAAEHVANELSAMVSAAPRDLAKPT